MNLLKIFFIFSAILFSTCSYSQWKGQCFGVISGSLTPDGQPNGKPSIPEQVRFAEYCSISFVGEKIFIKGNYS